MAFCTRPNLPLIFVSYHQTSLFNPMLICLQTSSHSQELAPGLEFNQEGMPIMPGLGPTTMPTQMPGMPGIPFPETTPDGQPCSVM
jgi:hypothetical protein